MSSTICGIVKAAITFCDIVNTADAIEQLRQGGEENNMLHTASLVNKLTILGFDCAEAAALAQGASNDNRFRSLEGKVLLIRGFMALSNLVLNICLFCCKVFKQFSLPGYVESTPRAAVGGRSLYEYLANFLESHQDEFEPVGEVQAGFNLLALRKIPEPLHADALLKRYICPVTQKPIRYPVTDPNGNAIYEREAILRWLETHGTSPVTFRPLHARDLVLKSDLKQMIDSRLRFHGERLQNYIGQNEDARGNFEAFNLAAPISFTFNTAIPQHLLFPEERELQRPSSVRAAVAVSTSDVANMRPLYERLAEFLHSRLGELKKDSQGKFSLLDLKEIPEPLHEDAFFSRHICPITQMPIRNPIGDANGTTVYEGQAIKSWLGVHRTSPVTREPFLVTEYFLEFNLRDQIKCRLRFYEKHLRSYLRRNQQAREMFASLYDSLSHGRFIDTEKGENELQFDERYLQELKKVQQARGIEDLDFIPEVFADDQFLRSLRCPITQRPIRHIVVINSMMGDSNHTFYERSAIMDFIDNRPGELPPRWPENTELIAEHLRPFRIIQSQIDEKLQRLLNEFMDIIEQTVSEWDL